MWASSAELSRAFSILRARVRVHQPSSIALRPITVNARVRRRRGPARSSDRAAYACRASEIQAPSSELRACVVHSVRMCFSPSPLCFVPRSNSKLRRVHPSNIVSSGFFVSYRVYYFDGIAVLVPAYRGPCIHFVTVPLFLATDLCTYPQHTMLMMTDRITYTYVGR